MEAAESTPSAPSRIAGLCASAGPPTGAQDAQLSMQLMLCPLTRPDPRFFQRVPVAGTVCAHGFKSRSKFPETNIDTELSTHSVVAKASLFMCGMPCQKIPSAA